MGGYGRLRDPAILQILLEILDSDSCLVTGGYGRLREVTEGYGRLQEVTGY